VGGEETVEIDPEVAMGLGWNEGMLASFIMSTILTKLMDRLRLGSLIIRLKLGMSTSLQSRKMIGRSLYVKLNDVLHTPELRIGTTCFIP
jgi:hypothetical protein